MTSTQEVLDFVFGIKETTNVPGSGIKETSDVLKSGIKKTSDVPESGIKKTSDVPESGIKETSDVPESGIRETSDGPGSGIKVTSDVPGSATNCKPLTLNNLESYIDNELQEIRPTQPEYDDASGRIGSSRVMFDVTSNVGSFVIDRDKLGVSSQSNFSSLRANVCVYKGKWHFELMLGSKGVMQIGWATLSCQFSQEKGVGDTSDSYAYDGNRVRKWNVATYKYGESWLTGDVIGCAIDLDKGAIHFYRNGYHLGEAFSNIKIGPGIAYFPAISLAYSENLVANFGATPLKYSIEGFRPLQDPPEMELKRANKLMAWLGDLLPIMIKADRTGERQVYVTKSHTDTSISHLMISGNAILMIVAAQIIHRLAPLLTSIYVTDGCLLNFLTENHIALDDNLNVSLETIPFIDKLLDTFWILMEEHEVKACMENLIICLLTAYRFSAISSSFIQQKKYLILTLAILRHRKTRVLLLKNVIFDKIKFPILLHVKPLDNDSLIETIPEVWWKMNEEKFSPDKDLPSNESKLAYEAAIMKLKESLKILENIQVELLKVLLDNEDGDNAPCSRLLFLTKFRDFLRENLTGSRLHPIHLCPLPVTLCFFHRLIQALQYYWDKYASSTDAHNYDITTSSGAYIPNRVFYDDSISFYEIQRVGGLLSHLKKTLRDDVALALGFRVGLIQSDPSSTLAVAAARNISGSVSQDSGPSTSGANRPNIEQKSLPKLLGVNETQSLDSVALPFADLGSTTTTESVPLLSLVELLDGIVLLYHISAHKQLAKMCSLRESMQDYINALEETEIKINHCENKELCSDVLSALYCSKMVFLEKLAEQSRHYAWIQAVIYSQEKQEDVYWLLHILLRTVNRASIEGPLFGFVPDYYIESCINCCTALRSYFINSAALPGYEETLVDMALFLSTHFSDKRVVNADIKDILIQAVASFVCHQPTLRGLEQMPKENRLLMVKALLQPYENRAWAQSNWILVRLWKGCGFGFRYTQPPHMAKRLSPKPQTENNIGSQYQKPCPSVLFQHHIAELLQEDPQLATSFLNSVLNQLNWSFSEFIGMLQEIQNASNRPERVFIDSRQLKICATCYDLALALLRVLEMVVHVSPCLFTDLSKPAAEPLLARLCQLLCQVLNRITSRSGCFDHVVAMEIPGLETIDHFPLVAAVTGILVQLLLCGSAESMECATGALLIEPSFQLSSIEFLLNTSQNASYGSSPVNKIHFSLLNYEEINVSEVEAVEAMLKHLEGKHKTMQTNSEISTDEEICTICYAHPITVVFKPCGHQSCRTCIFHHLMNKNECFFCKTFIDTVVDLNGKVIHDMVKAKPSK